LQTQHQPQQVNGGQALISGIVVADGFALPRRAGRGHKIWQFLLIMTGSGMVMKITGASLGGVSDILRRYLAKFVLHSTIQNLNFGVLLLFWHHKSDLSILPESGIKSLTHYHQFILDGLHKF